MIKKFGKNIAIKYEEADRDFVDSFDIETFEKFYGKIKSFFGIEKDLPLIKINFVYSDDEYYFFTGVDNRPKWNGARACPNTMITMIAPSKVEELTTHKKEGSFSCLVHESAHLVYGYVGCNNVSVFNEGIATYFQNGPWKGKKLDVQSLVKFSDYRETYPVGYFIVGSIVNHFGEAEAGKKLIEFLKTTTFGDEDKELFDKFEKVAGVRLEDILKFC